MSEVTEIPIGNAFSFLMKLTYKRFNPATEQFEVSVADNLGDALDIIVNVGVNPAVPAFTATLAGGNIQVDTPAVGYITIAVLSTDSLAFVANKTYCAVAQCRFSADNSNIVEWPKGIVFKSLENYIGPTSP